MYELIIRLQVEDKDGDTLEIAANTLRDANNRKKIRDIDSGERYNLINDHNNYVGTIELKYIEEE